MEDGRGRWSRRAFLGAGFGTAAWVAGCLRLQDDETPTPAIVTQSPPPSPTARETATPRDTPTESDTETETDEPTPEPGGTLRIALPGQPGGLDPVSPSTLATTMVTDRIFEGLYTYDKLTGQITVLAAGPPSVSNGLQRWTVEIARDASFQNGDPVRARDVEYSIVRAAEASQAYPLKQPLISSASVVDDRTVQFDLQRPYAAFQHVLHQAVVPRSVHEGAQDSFGANPVGSGPFRFEELSSGRWVLERWDGYWGDRLPSLGRVEFEAIGDATDRVSRLSNEATEIVMDVPPGRRSAVRDMGHAGIQEVTGTNYHYLAFNCNAGPTTDPAVREAIDYLVDLDAMVADVIAPSGTRQYSPLPRAVARDWSMPIDQWRTIPHERSVDSASALLADAGVPTDYEWTIILPKGSGLSKIAGRISDGLQEAGWSNVTVEALTFQSFIDRYTTGNESDYNMYLIGWVGLPDPDAFCFPLFGRTDEVLGKTNGCYYGANSQRGKDTATQLASARETDNRDERQALYQEAITAILEDRAHLPIYADVYSFGVADVVQDFVAHPVERMSIFSPYNDVSVG